MPVDPTPVDRADVTSELGTWLPTDPLRGMKIVAHFALLLGQVKRTGVRHPDQVTPEDVAEHTVMLAWLAPALADRFYPDLDVNLVASFAAVHDMPEIYAGDTPTIRITREELEEKARREAEGVEMIESALMDRLPWLPMMLLRYEAQNTPEARFVKAVDKLLPKLVHLIDFGSGLRSVEVTRAEFHAMATTQRESLAGYASDFPGLLELHKVLCDRVLNEVRFHGDTEEKSPCLIP